MTKEKSHISEEDFRRYLENEMTVNERNAFEKELHKDSFASEALEGFETIPLADMKNDLTQLKEKIHPPKHRTRYPYLAAAATILLIITAGIIWIQFNNENPVPEIAEKTEDRRPKTEDRSQKLEDREANDKEQFQFADEIPVTGENDATGTEDVEIAEPDDEIQTQALTSSPNKQLETSKQKQESINKQPAAANQAQDVSRNKPTPTAPELKAAQNVSREMDSNNLEVGGVKNETQIVEVSSKNRKINGKVISADDNQPLPGVTLVEKGTTNGSVTDIDGNFELQLLNDSNTTVVASFVGMEENEFMADKDSVYEIMLESSNIAMNEVVAVGYENQRKKSLTGSVSTVSSPSKNSQPEPVCGMEEYNSYLKNNAILTEEHSEEKVIVKLLLKLDHDGELISIENKNNTELEIFEKAKELVLKGPKWNPEIKNGENIESEVKLRIVFRKMN